MLIVNKELIGLIDSETLKKMGFTENNDGTGDPRGVDWEMQNEKFILTVDPWAIVKLQKIDKDFDPITLHIDSLDELEAAVEWINN